jgi:hypothetical protein
MLRLKPELLMRLVYSLELIPALTKWLGKIINLKMVKLESFDKQSTGLTRIEC